MKSAEFKSEFEPSENNDFGIGTSLAIYVWCERLCGRVVHQRGARTVARRTAIAPEYGQLDAGIWTPQLRYRGDAYIGHSCNGSAACSLSCRHTATGGCRPKRHISEFVSCGPEHTARMDEREIALHDAERFLCACCSVLMLSSIQISINQVQQIQLPRTTSTALNIQIPGC